MKFGNLGFSIEKVHTVDFSDTIAACDLKVGRCRQLIELMNVCEYQGHLHMKIKTCFSQKQMGHI